MYKNLHIKGVAILIEVKTPRIKLGSKCRYGFEKFIMICIVKYIISHCNMYNWHFDITSSNLYTKIIYKVQSLMPKTCDSIVFTSVVECETSEAISKAFTKWLLAHSPTATHICLSKFWVKGKICHCLFFKKLLLAVKRAHLPAVI